MGSESSSSPNQPRKDRGKAAKFIPNLFKKRNDAEVAPDKKDLMQLRQRQAVQIFGAQEIGYAQTHRASSQEAENFAKVLKGLLKEPPEDTEQPVFSGTRDYRNLSVDERGKDKLVIEGFEADVPRDADSPRKDGEPIVSFSNASQILETVKLEELEGYPDGLEVGFSDELMIFGDTEDEDLLNPFRAVLRRKVWGLRTKNDSQTAAAKPEPIEVERPATSDDIQKALDMIAKALILKSNTGVEDLLDPL